MSKEEFTIIDRVFNKKDIEDAYNAGCKADKTSDSKTSFTQWFKTKYPRNPIAFRVKDLSKYKPMDLEE